MRRVLVCCVQNLTLRDVDCHSAALGVKTVFVTEFRIIVRFNSSKRCIYNYFVCYRMHDMWNLDVRFTDIRMVYLSIRSHFIFLLLMPNQTILGKYSSHLCET